MSALPCVLGLDVDAARARLLASGCQSVEVRVTGRRREGRLRVIRQGGTGEVVILTATHFRALREEEPQSN